VKEFVAKAPSEKLVGAPFILHLLPALPSAWQEGSVSGLKARGGFTVDIAWSGGALKNATVTATKGGVFRIYDGNTLSADISLKVGESYSYPQ